MSEQEEAIIEDEELKVEADGEEKTSEEKGEQISAEDKELDDLKRQVAQMQEEAERIDEIQKEVEAQMGSSSTTTESKDIDDRSVYVGNVDYSTTPEELQAHFQSCGTINRVTILCDKFTGHPKGYAYVEFAEEEAVANSIVLNETLFKGRQIKVHPKRANIPGYNRGSWRSRSRGYRGYRGRPRRAYYHPYH